MDLKELDIDITESTIACCKDKPEKLKEVIRVYMKRNMAQSDRIGMLDRKLQRVNHLNKDLKTALDLKRGDMKLVDVISANEREKASQARLFTAIVTDLYDRFDNSALDEIFQEHFLENEIREMRESTQ